MNTMEKNEKTMTFNTCGEYIDHVIAKSKARQQEEQEAIRQEFLKSIEAVVEIGVIQGINVGQNLESFIENHPEDLAKEIFNEAVKLTTEETMKTILGILEPKQN